MSTSKFSAKITEKHEIANFDFENIDFENLTFRASAEIDDDLYINIDSDKQEVYLSDCNFENRQEVSQEEAKELLDLAISQFNDRYEDQIHEAKIEYRNWLKDTITDDQRKIA